MIKTLANKSYVPIAAAAPSNFYKATFQKGNTKIVGMVLPLSGHIKDISLRDSLGQLHRGPSNLVLLQKDICATKRGFLLFQLDIFQLVSIYFRMISPGHH